MNIRIKALKSCLFVAVAASITISASAQNYSIKNRWNTKLGYSSYKNFGHPGSRSSITPAFQAEANYGLLSFLEVGAYTGYSNTHTISMTPVGDGAYSGSLKATNAYFYGFNTNVHFLPFLLKTEKFRVDLYASGKCGGIYLASAENMWPERGHTLDYGIYAGAAFYLGEHWGLFGEYGLGNYTNHRFGLSFKF